MPEHPSQPEAPPEPLDIETLDAGEVFAQAAALAQHLQQAGVQWLPQPNAQEVESLTTLFRSATVSPIRSEAAGHPATPQHPATTQQPEVNQQPSSPAPQEIGTTPPRVTETVAPPVDSTGNYLPVIDSPYSGADLPDSQRSNCLAELADQVASCERCPALTRNRNHTVFGEGSVRPRVVFFGEAPGADEDRTGRPFVGAAGQLLTKMIEACKFSREEVYILNTIKCRPPNNRNPELEERANCRDYYRSQLNTLRPEYIVCLGAVAAQELLQNKVSVGSLRGKFHRYHDSKVLVTYHPAYLLREPTRKAAAWQDLQLMLRDAKIDF